VKLIRLASLQLTPAHAQARGWEARIGPVLVETLGHSEVDGAVYLLVAASVQLESTPAISGDGAVTIPEEPRERAEWAIEYVADTLAVQTASSRRVSSPTPSIALLPEIDAEREVLRVAVTLGGAPRTLMGALPQLTFDEISELCRGRRDGLALLAEALSHEHPTGRFHDLMRVFERAFRTNPNGFRIPLGEFLAGGPLVCSQSEVDGWVDDLRNAVTHANRPPGPMFGDAIRPALWRMEQAAYDTLLNKKNWGDRSTARRQGWMPTVTAPPQGGTFTLQPGKDAGIRFQILDPFGAWPLTFSYPKIEIPASWFVGQYARGPVECQAIKGKLG